MGLEQYKPYIYGKRRSFHPLEFIAIKPTMREINVSRAVRKVRHTCLHRSQDSKELSIVFSTNWPKIRNIKLPWRNSHAKKAWLKDFRHCAGAVFLLESGQSSIGTMGFWWFFSCQFQLRIPEDEIVDDQMRFKSFLLVNLQDLHFSSDWCFNRFHLSLCWFQLIMM